MNLTETQKGNCLLLAHYLDTNVKDEEYDQEFFFDSETKQGCAIGHAANFNFEGFSLTDNDSHIKDNPAKLTLLYHGDKDAVVEGIDHVFGKGTDDLFLSMNNTQSRNDAITMLRKWGNS